MQYSSVSVPISPCSYTLFKQNLNPLLGLNPSCSPLKKRASNWITTRAHLSTTRETVMKDFHERRALKIISGLQNFNKNIVASVITAADKGGATHVDIACEPELVRLATSLTSLPATPTMEAAYSISTSVKIPVLCSSGLSSVTAPMDITAGAAGVGVGSAVNRLNDVVAMIAEVRSIADSLGISADRHYRMAEKCSTTY